MEIFLVCREYCSWPFLFYPLCGRFIQFFGILYEVEEYYLVYIKKIMSCLETEGYSNSFLNVYFIETKVTNKLCTRRGKLI